MISKSNVRTEASKRKRFTTNDRHKTVELQGQSGNLKKCQQI